MWRMPAELAPLTSLLALVVASPRTSSGKQRRPPTPEPHRRGARRSDRPALPTADRDEVAATRDPGRSLAWIRGAIRRCARSDSAPRPKIPHFGEVPGRLRLYSGSIEAGHEGRDRRHQQEDTIR